MEHIEVPHPGAQAIVGRMLNDALRDHPDVKWLGLVSEDGFAVASEGEGGIDDDAVAAGAVRMMIQVRAVAKALGQPGTSQLFIEGEDNGICVIDKDPWVLLMVGAPGVPIGLLRYEAREIAETFPMGQRAALPEAEPPLIAATDFVELQQIDVVEETATEVVAEDAEDGPQVTEADGEEEIRWADEPTVDDSEEVSAVVDEPVVVEIADLDVAEEQPEAVTAISFTDWLEEEPAQAEAVPVESMKLEDLAPPAGPSIDLPPPAGPAFDLPPPE